MSRHACLFKDLLWLPRRPDDFDARCRALNGEAEDYGGKLGALAGHALDSDDLARLAKLLSRGRQRGLTLAPLANLTLGVISNATTAFLAPALTGSALRHGIALRVVETEFGQVLQEALTPDSSLHLAKPDMILVAVDHRGLPIQPCPGDDKAAKRAVEDCLAYFEAIRSGVRAAGQAVCVFQTLPRPADTLFGNLDMRVPGTMRSLIDAVNRGLAEMLEGSPDALLDVAGLAETVGLSAWHDPTVWNLAKVPFADDYLPIYAEHATRLIAAMRGKARRCLVLDLDNTLWGGVIGDDGLEGIVLGQGDPTGEAFQAVQRLALALRARGIVLAVSSKNNDEAARAPFRRHPEMLLRESHIAVFQANWNDKATNIEAIAKELSLGIDSMVFLDDNPMERDQVRQHLPQVAVPELPQDPALFAQTLMAGGYFESASFSLEDSKRADFYQDNARRVTLERQSGDLNAYLESLQMRISFGRFDDVGRARITQLINKSNQFNLTTKRYSELEVKRIQDDPDCLALQVRLQDKFGDNGMISVVICRRHGDTWDIDSWLMSCRVLKRKVEQAVLGELIRLARESGISKLVGQYIPTGRNALVADHFARLGFALAGSTTDGSSNWALEVDTAVIEDLPMSVHRDYADSHEP